MQTKVGKRGRPVGYVMSEMSKKKISAKLKGRVLSDEHKHKISVAMLGNTNRLKKNSPTFVDDLYNDYVSSYKDENVGIWIDSMLDKLELCSGIVSNRKLSGYSFTELNVDSMDNFGGNSLDPESLLILSEAIERLNVDV